MPQDTETSESVSLKPAWFMQGVPGQTGIYREILSEINIVRKSQTTNKQQQKPFQAWPKSGTSFYPWGGILDSFGLGLDRTNDKQRSSGVSPTVFWVWGLEDMSWGNWNSENPEGGGSAWWEVGGPVASRLSQETWEKKEPGYPSPGRMVAPSRHWMSHVTGDIGRMSPCGGIRSLLGDTPVIWFLLSRRLQATLLRKVNEI